MSLVSIFIFRFFGILGRYRFSIHYFISSIIFRCRIGHKQSGFGSHSGMDGFRSFSGASYCVGTFLTIFSFVFSLLVNLFNQIISHS